MAALALRLLDNAMLLQVAQWEVLAMNQCLAAGTRTSAVGGRQRTQ